MTPENTSIISIALTERYGELSFNPNSNFLRKETMKFEFEKIKDDDADLTIDEYKNEYFLNNVVHEIAKNLYSNTDEKTSLNLFLSHTKRDKVGLEKTGQLKRILETFTQADNFFDRNSIHIGSDILEVIEKNLANKKETFFAIMQTDAYSSSSWCNKEVLIAKENNKPLMIINAIEKNDERSFPYMGNTKVIRLNKETNFEYYKILTQIFLEAIRFKYNELKLDKYKDKANILLSAPELLDFSIRKFDKSTIIYPDPPLEDDEIMLFHREKIEFCTPLTYMKESKLLKGKTVMFSISETSLEQKYPMHSIITDLLKYSFYYGAKIAYGGVLNYKEEKLNLLIQMFKTIDLYKDKNNKFKILNHLAYPFYLLNTDEDREKFGSLIDMSNKYNPENSLENLEPNDVIENILKNPNIENFRVMGSSLTNMREGIIKSSDIVVIVGGKTEGYKGKYPGILEEFLLATEKCKPIFIVGSYGGVAKEIIKLIQNSDSDKLSEKYQFEKNGALYEEYYKENVTQRYSDIQSYIKKNGYSLLNNGLSDEENEELFVAEDSLEIMDYILTGINKLKGEQNNGN